MNGRFIISGSALGDAEVQEAAADNAAFRKWNESENNQLPSNSKDIRAVLEAASSNPIGLQILARRIVEKESYEDAISHVSGVTGRKISYGAARVQVHRAKLSILNAILE